VGDARAACLLLSAEVLAQIGRVNLVEARRQRHQERLQVEAIRAHRMRRPPLQRQRIQELSQQRTSLPLAPCLPRAYLP